MEVCKGRDPADGLIKVWSKKKQLDLPVVIISLKVIVELERRAAARDEDSGEVSAEAKLPAHQDLFLTHLYISPAERLVVFDLWGLGSPARLMSEENKELRLGADPARVSTLHCHSY